MRSAPLIMNIKTPFEARIEILFNDYASENKKNSTEDWEGRMASAIQSLKRRLGVAKCVEL
jgi:hypothetical protein